MAHCVDRLDPFSRKIDQIDRRIARLVKLRDELMRQGEKCYPEYDCDGEGEAYFRELGLDRGERVYHAVAGMEE
jgi:hypothetical protein